MFEKFWANIIRYYTNKVRLRGLTQKQGFETHAGGEKSERRLPPLAQPAVGIRTSEFCLCSQASAVMFVTPMSNWRATSSR